jgi:hypothetical protein
VKTLRQRRARLLAAWLSGVAVAAIVLVGTYGSLLWQICVSAGISKS